MFSSDNIFIKYLPYLGILVISLLAGYHVSLQGGDQTFPILGSTAYFSYQPFLYLWSDGMLGSTTVIEKMRGIVVVIFSILNIYNSFFFYSIAFFISTASSIYVIRKYFDIDMLPAILLAFLYTYNPLTIAHTGHILLVFGFSLYPIILYIYIEYMCADNFKKSYKYISWFLLFTLFLGQPHNYYNILICLLFVNIGLYQYIKVGKLVYKNLILGLIGICTFSYFIFSFLGTYPNDLTSGSQNFSGAEPNMIWSRSQGLINSIVFSRDIIENTLGHIGFSVFIVFYSCIFCIGFYGLVKHLKEVRIKKILSILFVCILGLSFIGKIYFGNIQYIKEYIYKAIPHIRVDISYIIILLVILIIIGIAYSIKDTLSTIFKKIIYCILGFIVLLNSILFLTYNRQSDMLINKSEFVEFNTWISHHINKKNNSNTIIYPLNVLYPFPGVSKGLYPAIGIQNIFHTTYFHWMTLEGSLLIPLEYISKHREHILDIEHMRVLGFHYVLCFREQYNCQILPKKYSHISLMAEYRNSVFLYKVNMPTPIIEGNIYTRISPVEYRILSSGSSILFRQSFHPEWKLYLEPFAPLDCGSGATAYSGATDTPTGKMLSGAIYIVKSRDDYARIARAYTGLTVEDLTSLNPDIDPDDLKIGMEIVLSLPTPEVRQEPYHVTECPSSNSFYVGGELSKLWEKPIFDDTHRMVYDYANQWTIDPEYIKANYSREYYRINPDGTMDVRMTMYFRPQSYFYLGLIISGVTLFGCITYLVVSGVRGSRRRKHLAKPENTI